MTHGIAVDGGPRLRHPHWTTLMADGTLDASRDGQPPDQSGMTRFIANATQLNDASPIRVDDRGMGRARPYRSRAGTEWAVPSRAFGRSAIPVRAFRPQLIGPMRGKREDDDATSCTWWMTAEISARSLPLDARPPGCADAQQGGGAHERTACCSPKSPGKAGHRRCCRVRVVCDVRLHARRSCGRDQSSRHAAADRHDARWVVGRRTARCYDTSRRNHRA
jgi:hypothetical protein